METNLESVLQALKDKGLEFVNGEIREINKKRDFIEQCQNGDVLVCNFFVFIFKGIEDGCVKYHCAIAIDDNEFHASADASYMGVVGKNNYRKANEREKAMMFKAIEDNGYVWDKETNTLSLRLYTRHEAEAIVADFIKEHGGNLYASDTPLEVELLGEDIEVESVWYEKDTNEYYLHCNCYDFEADVKLFSLTPEKASKVASTLFRKLKK